MVASSQLNSMALLYYAILQSMDCRRTTGQDLVTLVSRLREIYSSKREYLSQLPEKGRYWMEGGQNLSMLMDFYFPNSGSVPVLRADAKGMRLIACYLVGSKVVKKRFRLTRINANCKN